MWVRIGGGGTCVHAAVLCLPLGVPAVCFQGYDAETGDCFPWFLSAGRELTSCLLQCLDSYTCHIVRTVVHFDLHQ
jgi:hypothetical protein